VPIGILALTRLGIVTPAKLRAVRRYAYVACAVAAMLLPGVDPISMLLETAPLIVLYELSILLASALGTSPKPLHTTEGATQ
jgi:sec-independent protein translocase protein TatC